MRCSASIGPLDTAGASIFSEVVQKKLNLTFTSCRIRPCENAINPCGIISTMRGFPHTQKGRESSGDHDRCLSSLYGMGDGPGGARAFWEGFAVLDWRASTQEGGSVRRRTVRFRLASGPIDRGGSGRRRASDSRSLSRRLMIRVMDRAEEESLRALLTRPGDVCFPPRRLGAGGGEACGLSSRITPASARHDGGTARRPANGRISEPMGSGQARARRGSGGRSGGRGSSG